MGSLSNVEASEGIPSLDVARAMTGMRGLDEPPSSRIVLLELIHTAMGMERTSQESNVRLHRVFSGILILILYGGVSCKKN
jgi:hypothetical protein